MAFGINELLSNGSRRILLGSEEIRRMLQSVVKVPEQVRKTFYIEGQMCLVTNSVSSIDNTPTV